MVPASPQVHEKGPLAVAPLVRQPNSRSVQTDVRHITRLLWNLTFLTICWAIIIVKIRIRTTRPWDPLPATWTWTGLDTVRYWQSSVATAITKPWRLALGSSHSSIPYARLALCRADRKYNTRRTDVERCCQVSTGSGWKECVSGTRRFSRF